MTCILLVEGRAEPAPRQGIVLPRTEAWFGERVSRWRLSCPPESGCRRKVQAPLAVRAGYRRADQELAHLPPVLGGPVMGVMAGHAPRPGGGEGLADQAERAG